MDLGLSGAAVCVQGGTRGMGRAAAECFAREGARVAVLARGQDGIDETVDRLLELGSPDAFGVGTDLSDTGEIDESFSRIADRWGHLNTLVNAVGAPTHHHPWHEATDEQWGLAFTLGVLAAVRCARAAHPLLKAAPWARIVNISAMSTRNHGPGLIEYTAGKSALNSAGKSLSLELGAEGILVNTVSPGAVLSDQVLANLAKLPSDRRPDLDDLGSVMRYMTATFGTRSDIGRVGEPAEVGAVVCFIGSAANSYMTGANINVDGGSAFYA
ncbi:SDR family oxidoreductase [Aeromicrobium sp. SMF47]|uniref:SDR family NAD(P)-dependent oxidoreductase n=1 Tax=Aeromicrobium yanjiei TaxID=2662028 RepID=UPI00129E6BB8|nr:SDR family oxidoreductase [Aeromicrobium yanjiei]MRJ77304.1 SDR family oxidoreductase [Aeromicrobium yanjiei]